MRSYVRFAVGSAILDEASSLLLLELVYALSSDFRERCGRTAISDDGIFH